MQKTKVRQKKAFIKKSDIRLTENKAPDISYAQSTSSSVPIVGVHEKYQFIEIYRNHYVECLLLGENNYLTAPEEEQLTIYKGWNYV